MTYEQDVLYMAEMWKHELNKKPSMFERAAKRAQIGIANKIPERFHLVVTEAMKKMVSAVLTGSDYTTKLKEPLSASFQEREEKVKAAIKRYQKTASLEGAGTGAGGIFLGMADFPLFLSIKMKCLFQIALLYGLDLKKYEERIYLLHIFHLAFCRDDHKNSVLQNIKEWEENPEKEIDWRTFQQEYRDYLDLAKLLQLAPGVGAVVGAVVNYRLVEHLGETAMNVYRLRLLPSEREEKI
jgi:EcsC protein family